MNETTYFEISNYLIINFIIINFKTCFSLGIREWLIFLNENF